MNIFAQRLKSSQGKEIYKIVTKCILMLHNQCAIDVYDMSYSAQKLERHKDLHEIMFKEY